jgi:hypothetical protein
MTVIPHPPYFSLFPQLKTKLKGRHFDTIDVIEAESQSVLYNLTKHSQRYFFDQMAAPIPEIMDGFLYKLNKIPA